MGILLNVYFTQLAVQKVRAHVFHSKSFTVLILEHSSARNQQTLTHFTYLFPVVSDKPILWLGINQHRPWFDKVCHICSIHAVKAVLKDLLFLHSGLHKGYMMDSTLTLQHLGFSVIMYMFWMLRWAGILLSSHLTLGPQWLYTSLINCMLPVVIQFYSVLIQKMIQSCFKTKIHVADRASKLSQVYKRSLKALLHFPHQNRKTWYV